MNNPINIYLPIMMILQDYSTVITLFEANKRRAMNIFWCSLMISVNPQSSLERMQSYLVLMTWTAETRGW